MYQKTEVGKLTNFTGNCKWSLVLCGKFFKLTLHIKRNQF